MLRKKESYTTITPIPGFIPRQLAIDILHSHSEVITLNPLVIDHRPIPAPRDAASDEYYSTWYEIEERMQFIPGMGKMGSGKIKFNGCFHDMPWGLQTHTYAPMNVDVRIKYRIDGNQPGVEPPNTAELGLSDLGVPADGLYMREDIEIRCNVTIVKYVKEQLKAASKEMVSRIIKKAELLDAGVLQGMIEDGKIRTINPNDRSSNARSPSFQSQGLGSPVHELQRMGSKSPSTPYQVPRPASHMNNYPTSFHQRTASGSQLHYHQQPQQQQGYYQPPPPHVVELPPQGGGQMIPPPQPAQQTFVAELPGNFYHPQQPQRDSQRSSPPPSDNRDSSMSQQSRLSPDPSKDWRWSNNTNGNGQGSPSFTSSRPTSLSSDASSTGGGMTSPGLDKGFSNELPTHTETQEEHRQMQQHYPGRQSLPSQYQQQGGRQQDMQKTNSYQHYPYSPADYARMR